MDEFLRIATSFPTIVYSVLLAVVTAHWLLSALGLFQIDGIDGLVPEDLGGDGGTHGGFSWFLLKFGLHGVPVMVIVTIIAIVGWTFCYFVELYALSGLAPGAMAWALDAATLAGGLLLAIPVARLVLAPVRRMLRRFAPVSQRPMLGRRGDVRSPEVTATGGSAWFEDGGAGLVLQVRAEEGARFVRGDHVVLIEYLDAQNAYRVMSGEDFDRL